MTIYPTRRQALTALAFMPLALDMAMQEATGQALAPSILDYIPAALHKTIRDGTITVDLGRFYDAAFAAHPMVLFPGGTYTHASYTIPAGRTILTHGTATIFRQLPSASTLDSLFVISGSDIRIDGCVLQGLIALFDPKDTQKGGNSEFNHGIAIRATSDGPPVHGIVIGDVVGRDIRGDIIAITCLTRGQLTDITIGHVFGENILRNGVSIVGGRHISIASIDGSAFGYAVFDIEPEGAYAEPVSDVHVGRVRGAVAQIAATPDTRIDRVTIDQLDTDPSFATTSHPPYRDRRGELMLDTKTGLRLRNATAIRIGRHHARGHAAHAIGYQGDPTSRVSDPSLEIGAVDYADIGRGERVYQALIVGTSLHTIAIAGGSVSMATDSQRLILGNPDSTHCRITGVQSDGMIVAYATASTLSDLHVAASSARGFAMGLSNSVIADCDIQAGYLGYNLTGCDIRHCRFTLAKGGRGTLLGRQDGTALTSTTIL